VWVSFGIATAWMLAVTDWLGSVEFGVFVLAVAGSRATLASFDGALNVIAKGWKGE